MGKKNLSRDEIAKDLMSTNKVVGAGGEEEEGGGGEGGDGEFISSSTCETGRRQHNVVGGRNAKAAEAYANAMSAVAKLLKEKAEVRNKVDTEMRDAKLQYLKEKQEALRERREAEKEQAERNKKESEIRMAVLKRMLQEEG